ncbi:MAG: regulatory protein RecX [Anaerolineae bacterium]
MIREITALKIQKGNKRRVNIYLDGEYAFSLSLLEAVHLKRGQRLSDEEVAALRERDAFQKAYDRALKYLSYRPRSRAEIERYLQEKHIPPPLLEEVLARLEGAGLVDDLAFTRFWVENRKDFNPRGLSFLRYELRRKGISEDVISQALEEVDEEQSAYALARKRALRMTKLDQEKFYRKLGDFLTRRGFPYETVSAVVQKVWQEIATEQWDDDEHKINQ